MPERLAAHVAGSRLSNMARDEHRILARELGKIGGPGAYLAAWLLPNHRFELTLQTSSPIEQAAHIVGALLSCEGRLLDGCEREKGKTMICGIVGAGYLDMNPVLIKVALDLTAEGMTRLIVRGVAKEGLIRQQAAEQTVRRIAGLLAQSLDEARFCRA